MQAIILAGGLGTRLRSVVADVPKPMAPIGNEPFLALVLRYLQKQGIKRVILAVSYRYECIQDYFGKAFLGMQIAYSIEPSPLGTGGAIKLALELVEEQECYVLNGDSLFEIKLSCLSLQADQSKDQKSKICLALKKMQDNKQNKGRYGGVLLDEKGFVRDFCEKGASLKEPQTNLIIQHASKPANLINGGVYLLDHDILSGVDIGESFLFESFLQRNFAALNARGVVFDSYFIDIGIPEDYAQFQQQKRSER